MEKLRIIEDLKLRVQTTGLRTLIYTHIRIFYNCKFELTFGIDFEILQRKASDMRGSIGGDGIT